MKWLATKWLPGQLWEILAKQIIEAVKIVRLCARVGFVGLLYCILNMSKKYYNDTYTN